MRCLFTTCDKACDTKSISLKCLKRINKLTMTRNLFFMTSDDSQGGGGHLDLPLSVGPSVCLSVVLSSHFTV